MCGTLYIVTPLRSRGLKVCYYRMKNRRYVAMDLEPLVSLNKSDGLCSPSSVKGMKSSRLLYRRMAKARLVGVVVLVVIMVYAFLSLIFHLNSLDAFTTPYDARPLSDPQISSDGSTVFRLAVVTDLDKDSKTGDGSWKSYLRRGTLEISSDRNRVSIQWDKHDDVTLLSQVASGGRAMELSDLVVFNHRLLTVDDRTGIVYMIEEPSGSTRAVPWIILGDGPGNVTKSFKGEWMTVKDRYLYVGGLGKEWTDEKGKYINDHPMWVKRVDPWGRVQHLQWTETYKAVRRAMGIEWPGYMVHEAVQWSPYNRRWFFLPRRVSFEVYDEEADEGRGSNVLVSADEYFSSTPVITRIGMDNRPSTKGFAAFQFIPGTNDQLIVALKSEEKGGHPVGSYITVFDIDGRVLLKDQPLEGAFKFEGIAMI